MINREIGEKTQEIYDRLAYYVGHYVKKISGNLNANGSDPSEANYSSITANFSGSEAWTLTFHLHNLRERQHYLLNKDIAISDNVCTSQQK